MAPLRLPPPLRLLCALLLLPPPLGFFGGAPPHAGLPLALAAAGRNVVTHLPGFHGPLPFYLETGYVGMGGHGDDEVQLFYYFVASERDAAEDPLLLWLTGGPGCSALLALADEIGPLNVHKVRYDGTIPSLELNLYSWSKWLDAHPQFISNPFYVGGESYSGRIVPIVTHFIAQGIKGGDKPLINLKGYLVGNPLTVEKADLFSRVRFLYQMNIISEEIYESTVKHCQTQDYENPESAECAKNLGVVKKFLSEINAASTLEKRCALPSPRPMSMEGDRRSHQGHSGRIHSSLPVPEVECREYNFYLIYQWANNVAVRKALHVQEGSVEEWERCSSVVTRHYTYGVENVVTYHLNLTSSGYRALVYSGDHDAILPFTGTQAWLKSLNYSIVDDWRSWHVDGQVAGYTRSYANNLTYATVKGAGHTPPEFKPKECLTMFYKWISHNPL